MTRGRLYLVAPLVLMGLFGCRAFNFEERAPWRAQAEEQCIAQKLVQPSAFAEPGPEISGPGTCGMNYPFKIQAAADGYVGVQPKATLGCPMAAGFNRWVTEVVQPAAQAWYGETVVEVKQLSSYACRRMVGAGGHGISEHAYGNALDVSAFTFQSGRRITVEHGWRGTPEERGFLRQIHAGACEVFTTVLGPGYNAAHYNHFHFDLAQRNRVVCRPEPQLVTPPRTPPRRFEEMPMVRHAPPKQRFPIARAEPQPESDYEDDDARQPQYAPRRAPNQPIAPDQAYPPPSRQTVQQPMVLNPQDPASYPAPTQHLRAPNAQPAHVQPPQQHYPPEPQHVQRPQMQWQQGPQPAYTPPPPQSAPAYQPPPNPNRLVPPGRVGNLKNSDPVVTGAIKNRKHYKDAPQPQKFLPKAEPGVD